MRTEQEIRDMLRHIKADERLSYDPARVDVNAPLALIQMELEARVAVLEWALGLSDNGGGSAGEPSDG